MLYERVGVLYSLPAYLENTARKGITVISGIFHFCDIFFLLSHYYCLFHCLTTCCVLYVEWMENSLSSAIKWNAVTASFPSCSAVRHKKCFPHFPSYWKLFVRSLCEFSKIKKKYVQWPCMTSNWKLKIYWK